MGFADLHAEDAAVLFDDEGGGVGGFAGGVPAEAVEVGDGEVGVDDEVDVAGDGAGGCEVGGLGDEVGGWAGIDEDDLGVEGGELRGVLLEVVELLQAVGTLVAGVSAKNDEDDASLTGEGGELQGGAAECGKGEVGRVIGYARDSGESGYVEG